MSAARGLALAAFVFLVTGTAARTAQAQERLLGGRTGETGVVYERWSFSGGVPRGGASGDSIRVESASQLSVPITVILPIGSSWTFDAYAAYATGEVSLDRPDSTEGGTSTYQLNGLTDVKLRLVGALRGDNLLLTLGLNAPSGTTGLDREQLKALQVLGAPALRFRTPSLGGGVGGTIGLVAAQEIGGWAWALGTSYELRGGYRPIEALVAGSSQPDLDPGDAVHLSLGTDGLLGPHRMSVTLSGDLYSKDQLTFDVGAGETKSTYTLGPSYGAEWQLQLAPGRFRELALYVVDRYRTQFKDNEGDKVDGSSGNELDAGATALIGRAGRTGVLLGLDGRFHTGLSVDNTIATAAMRAFGATAGLSMPAGRLDVRPFVRAQLGSIKNGGESSSASGLSGGLTFGTRF